MPRQKAASLTIQWRISQKTCDRLFLSNILYGNFCVALSIKNIKTRASREMTSQQKWGERCQALECGRARYLPSLIALLSVGLRNLFERSFFRVRDDVSRPEVTQGSLLIYFLLILTDFKGNALSKAHLYMAVNSLKDSFGQFIWRI